MTCKGPRSIQAPSGDGDNAFEVECPYFQDYIVVSTSAWPFKGIREGGTVNQ